MRALVQRVSEASVTVDGTVIGEIGVGVLVLVCAMQGDSTREAEKLAEKLAKLRIFGDTAGKMNRALLDTGGAALVVSQFTLAADTTRGNRPGFSTAAAPDLGAQLYEHFAAHLASLGPRVETGRFGADMKVGLINDGPVTIWLEIPPDGGEKISD
ncbi:D-aminoacyl-tRNA deacylase [Tropicimonas sp. IMCC6043]|uniref:D-aminoacyl-tRNA deacylase n=1 Tax=Tropicimonas sp. IMCC6043 TaxID=2510645 RepID=UPI00101D6F73|nr:D-aminoacyl-tRNA deacylase [Tropicimonas sp. IMCC6043]RYH10322.1 D-tyrosyl-tRNA(Tyr) deacylase [Tropicimonas sp. IMCC6043]